ncbi:MAG: undecaprenyl-phosphate glucose phosphotransferase [Myxococcota bacterium]|nr:undecaprenyl-phosphate glucose phosphotransferase [Myxococcota bacterium]
MTAVPEGALRPHTPLIGVIQRASDALWIVVAHLVATALFAGDPWSQAQTVATCVAALAFQLVAELSDLYQAWRGVPFRKELMRVLIGWGIAAPVLLVALFLTKSSDDLSRVVTVAWFVLAPTLVAIWRSMLRVALHRLRISGRNTRSVAIVGMTEMGEMVSRRIAASPWLGMRIAGFYDDRTIERCHPVPEELGTLSGSFDDLIEHARSGRIDLVYMALPLRAEPRVNQLVRKLSDSTVSVYFVPDFQVSDLLAGRWSSLDDIPVISIFESPFYGVDGLVKRIEDLVLGTLAVMVASPVMIAAAIAIKLTSKGPVFFRQRRYGLNGEVIEVLKFRSMCALENGPVITQATRQDARITPVGRFLRRSSIDELPQLFHVLSGTMSLVGPRPHAVAHNEEYRKRIHGYMLRHKVKPGLTGWAQVNGWRGETDTLEKMEKRIEHDLEYIRSWGLLFDLKIVLLTVFSRRVHQNAY